MNFDADDNLRHEEDEAEFHNMSVQQEISLEALKNSTI